MSVQTVYQRLNELGALLDQKAKPESGVELPVLTKPGSSNELFEGYDMVNGDGERVVGSFTIAAELTNQDTLISEIKTALQGKTAASGGVGNLTKYAKIIATPASTTSFYIENPLGGIVKKVFVRRTTDTASSSRRCQQYIADFELGIGVAEFIDTSGKSRYPVTETSGTVNNAYFKMTEDAITLYRYNSANAWDNTAEYEVEIYG